MIRYIYIGDQIEEDSEDFCFYDTITDDFFSLAGQNVFSSLNEFVSLCVSERIENEKIQRMLNLIPNGGTP